MKSVVATDSSNNFFVGSQIQSKFKAASCNVCINDINISNIGGRVDLKVTFSQQSTLNIKKRSSLRLSMCVNNQVEPASVQPTKKLRRVSSHFVAKTTTCCICMWKLSFLKYGNTHLIS
jgi:hypothetical protein